MMTKQCDVTFFWVSGFFHLRFLVLGLNTLLVNGHFQFKLLSMHIFQKELSRGWAANFEVRVVKWNFLTADKKGVKHKINLLKLSLKTKAK